MSSDIEYLLNSGAWMRVGRSLGRTLYLVRPGRPGSNDDAVIGMVDSRDLALEIAWRWNNDPRTINPDPERPS